LGNPVTDKTIKAAIAVIDGSPTNIKRGHCLDNGSDVIEALLWAALIPQAVNPPSTPTVAPPWPSDSQGKAGNSNSQMPLPLFCSETPISQPISPIPKVYGVKSGTGEAGATPRAKGKKPSTPQALSVKAKLLVFDIYNIFCCHWFLSWDHLMANTILAQKAEDGKNFWVEFAPQFHAHLVKCAVVLVPCPLNKVKKVMFGYILELLNGEGP
jgi:hypothetical protein